MLAAEHIKFFFLLFWRPYRHIICRILY